MQVSGVNSNTGTTSANAKGNDAIDKESFLKLLVAQLKYQDPLSPVDNTEFISQTAQFSTLEAIQNLSKEFIQTKAYSLLGKEITAQITSKLTGTVNIISGKVDSITISGDEVLLHVGDEVVGLERIVEVRNGE